MKPFLLTKKFKTMRRRLLGPPARFYQQSVTKYYLKCSTFSGKVRTLEMKTQRMEIVPGFRAKEFLELMKDGLKDVSISRPKKEP